MQRSTELSTFGMTNNIYRDPLYRANAEVIYRFKGWNSVAIRLINIRMGKPTVPRLYRFGGQVISCKALQLESTYTIHLTFVKLLTGFVASDQFRQVSLLQGRHR